MQEENSLVNKLRKKSNYKHVMFIFIALFFILFLSKPSAGESTSVETKKVLFISSYNAAFDTLPDQVKGIKEIFDQNNVKFDIEYMDTKRVNTKENYQNFYNFLKYRLENVAHYDVVLVGDDNALQFLMDYRDSLFPLTPIVFFCVNDMDRAKIANELPLITGIVEGISVDTNIALAIELFPNAKTIYGIVDNSSTGIGDAASFLAASKNHPERTYQILNSSDYSMDDFKLLLESVYKDDVIFYMSMFEDADGNNYSIGESVDIISSYTNAPVFRMSIGGIGSGLLGGNMVSYDEQGRQAAMMAVSILNGENPNAIQMINISPNKYYFDYKVMKKYGLSLTDVPKESIIINAPFNFYEHYKRVLIPALSIFILLMIFIIVLIRDNQKLKTKDKLLYENNIELTSLYEEMAASEEELRNQFDQIVSSQKALHESEERYKILAFTDTLTELSNRSALMRFLDYYVQNDMQKWALVYIDLDNFKYINDSRGHEVGDEILRQISKRLKAFEDEYIFLSRLGGDEFVLVIDTSVYDEYAEHVIKKVMTSIEKVISLRGLLFYLTCSIGVSNFPRDGFDKNVLLRKADMAMYRSKFSGRSRYLFYNEEMEIEFTEKLMIQNQIRFALDQNQFVLMYQPQIDLISDKIVGSEALIRWRDSNGNFIAPGLFIPIAEEQGLIKLIGKWVYEEAIKESKKWEIKYNIPLKIAVNVSALELSDEAFAIDFLALVKKYDLNPLRIAVEVTESILIEARGNSILQLERLREAGVQVHLDDFGTGYSSLNYMINLPLDVIKIDQQFISDMLINQKYEAMAKFIIDISHYYGLSVIAEGVETKEQYEKLKEMNCDVIQGFYFAKPMTADAFYEFYIAT